MRQLLFVAQFVPARRIIIFFLKFKQIYLGDEHIIALNSTKIKLCLDKNQYEEKPDSKDSARITKRIAKEETEISLEDFALAAIQGQTWTPAYFDGVSRKNDTWRGQQLFALDFDDNCVGQVGG